MKTGRVIVFVLAFLTVCSVSAQIVPGYQGKKTFVDYKFNISPALRHPTFLNKIADKQRANYASGTVEASVFLPFNTTHSLSIERVMSRKFSMSFNYSFAASKDYFNFNQNINDAATGESNTYTFTNNKMNIFGHYYTGSLIFYGKNSLAPYGKYFKITAGYCDMMGKFVEKELVSKNKTSSGTNIVLNSDVGYFKTRSFGWGFSFGTNRIYKNRIVVSHGVSLFMPVKPDDYGIYSASQSLKGVTTTIAQRLHFRDIATFYLGFGYLF